MTRALSARPDLDQYRKQAKELLRAHAAGEDAAIARIRSHHPRHRRAAPDAIRGATFVLADAQLVLARELGFPSWPRFKQHVERLRDEEIRPIEQGFFWYADQAGRIVSMIRAGGEVAFETARRWHPELAGWTDEELAVRDYSVEDGRLIIARQHGFDDWVSFVDHLEAVGEGAHEFATADPATATEEEERYADGVRAIQKGQPDALRQLVAASPGLVRARGEEGLVYASANGRLEAVDTLLDRGADPNAAPYQQTALFAAVGRGSVEVARRLLERGADVNARGDWAAMTDLTALHHAASVSRLEMAKLLVEAGADLEARDAVASGTPAGWAAHFGSADIERYLKEVAAEPE